MTREEAIERIKARFDKWALDDEDMKAIQTLIPELKESEDERIIKTLQEYVKNRNWPLNGPTQDEVLAYLEKQKEPENTSASTMAPSCWEVEQKEQKPISFNVPFNPDDYEVVMEGNATGLKQKEQKSAEWDELQTEFRSINEAFEDGKKEVIEHPEKYGLQKPGWSEEDEEMLDAMIDIVSNSLYEPLCPREGMLAWLKSLRPSRKPSEEQMEALHTAMYLEEMQFYGGLKDKLRDLYEQLKKL